jgi:TDG/mug DNA glycosylase family protein
MYAEWTPRLFERLTEVSPHLAVFHGVTGYRPFLRHALGVDRKAIHLGPQPEILGSTRLYVVPNPSPANAHFTLDDQTAWYDRVADALSVHVGAGGCDRSSG